MITRAQLQELKTLGKPLRYKIVKDRSCIRVESRRSIIYFAYDLNGYQELKALLERLRAKFSPKTD